MKKRTLQSLIRVNRLEITAAIGLIAAALLYVIRLGSIPTGMSGNESLAYHQNLHISNILHNPLNAPYNLIDYVLLHLPGHTVAVARLTSAGFALLAIVLFFIIMLRWHGKRTAWLATILFATSGWLLHIGRLGTPTIMWFIIPLIIILLGSWMTRTEHHSTAIVVVAALLGLMLFIPAGIWFVAAYGLLLGTETIEHWREARSLQRSIAAILLIVFAAAIAFSLYRTPSLIRPWLGIPQTMPTVVSEAKVWVSSIVLYAFFRGPYSPELWLGHAPILDVFTTTMFAVGAYFYATHFHNLRTRTIAVLALIGSILTMLNGPAAMSFLVPLTYLVAATGITFLLHEWLTVFPRNPVARFVGITLMSLALVTAVTYHLVSYYVAWQHDPTTISKFHYKP